MALPQYFLQDLKMRSDIGDIAGAYVNLKRRGKNLVGLCPFHNEKTPSFHIYPENGSFYCFGCSAGGDVITFVMRIENLDYMEAIRFLAQRAGMQMPEDGVDSSMAKLRTRILEINREAARFYHGALKTPEGRPGAEYLHRRQMDTGTITHFGLGYAPDNGFSLVNYLKGKGYTNEEMVQANVAGISKKGNLYDRFRARAMFPIIDLRGNVVAFGGRILTDEKPKYINTSDTPVYHKSAGLFAMNFAKDSGQRQLILAEGYMDVIALHRAGFTNAIASLGTSLTEEQARILSRYADEVIICYDADEAGQRATQRAIPILKNAGLFIKVLSLPGGKDPDEFIRNYGTDGPARLRQLIEKSGNEIEYKLHKLRADYDVKTSEGKIKYLQEAALVLAEEGNVLSQDIFAGQLSQEFSVGKDAILGMVKKNSEKKFKKQRQAQQKVQNQISAAKTLVNTDKNRNFRIANAEEGILAFLFQHPDRIVEMGRRIAPERFITAFNRRIYLLLLEKTIEQEITLSDFSAVLTTAEMSELAKILHENQQVVGSWNDMLLNIEIILSGAALSDEKELKMASNEALMESLGTLKRLKEQKNRGNG